VTSPINRMIDEACRCKLCNALPYKCECNKTVEFEGAMACAEFVKRRDNPYPKGTQPHRWWRIGWDTASKAIRVA
jgi:hypothetical protein